MSDRISGRDRRLGEGLTAVARLRDDPVPWVRAAPGTTAVLTADLA